MPDRVIEMSGNDGSDHSLLRRFRSGEEDAATALYLRYARRLQMLARKQISPALSTRFDPEDVVQSVFRTFFRRAKTGCYDVPEGEELWQLLLVLALNKVRSLAVHHRAVKRDAAATVPTEPQTLSQLAGDGGNEQSMSILQMVIDELLDDFSPSGREIVTLRIDGHRVQEIAEQTGRSKRTVERILQDFRRRLGNLVDEQDDSINH
jgi:RNA polymerase sigma-70 factor (ECF subfamily)